MTDLTQYLIALVITICFISSIKHFFPSDYSQQKAQDLGEKVRIVLEQERELQEQRKTIADECEKIREEREALEAVQRTLEDSESYMAFTNYIEEKLVETLFKDLREIVSRNFSQSLNNPSISTLHFMYLAQQSNNAEAHEQH